MAVVTSAPGVLARTTRVKGVGLQEHRGDGQSCRFRSHVKIEGLLRAQPSKDCSPESGCGRRSGSDKIAGSLSQSPHANGLSHTRQRISSVLRAAFVDRRHYDATCGT